MCEETKDVKVCVIGDAGVGKTCIVNQFIDGMFTSTSGTIGASFKTKLMTVDSMNYRFNVWDTAGQERYRSLAPIYYRGANAAIVVYDITDRKSFDLLKFWIQQLAKYTSSDIVTAVAGNKLDLSDGRKVTKTEGVEYANSCGALYMETSALQSTNIQGIFEEIGRRLTYVEEDNLSRQASQEDVHLIDVTERQSKCWYNACCCRDKDDD